MKTRSKLRFCWLTVLISLMLACTKDVTIPDLEGSLVGYVYTFDESGTQTNDNEDVEIAAIAGTAHYNINTDQTGRFEFKGLPSGTYDLVIEKEGFGIMKQFGIQHLGGKPTIMEQPYFLYNSSMDSVTNLSIEDGYLYATIDFYGNTPEDVQVVLYFSKDQGFDIESTTASFSVDMFRQATHYTGFFPPMEINFQAGETWYYKGVVTCSKYGVSDRGAFLTGISYYFDYTLNKIIYPGAGPESSEFIYEPQ
jgi:hypothetical protein